MTIYIETFLLQNILIDFCLLRLVLITSKSQSSFFRLLLASIISAGFSVITAMFIINNFMINLIKIVCAVAMIKIAFKQTKKQFIYNFILLFLFTYALGGAITSLTSSSYQTSFGMIMTSKVSLELISIIAIIITYIYELVVKNIKFKIKSNNLIYTIILKDHKTKLKLNAYLDTGNLLSYQGQPVLILDINAYLKLTRSNLINFYLSKTETISLGTVAGNDQLKLTKIDEVTIKINHEEKKFKNQYIAVSTNNFKQTNYQALLSPLFL